MNRRGFSLVEVIIALAIVAIAIAILSTALVGNLRFTDVAGARTQTTQYLSFIGRRVAGGAPDVLPAAGASLTWGYGTLAAAFDDLPTGGGGRDDVARYRAQVDNVANVTFVGATAVQYRVTVCSQTASGESCTTGVTVGPAPSALVSEPPLPGIN